MNEYDEIAYRHLGLATDGPAHNLGTFCLIDLPEEILKPIALRRQRHCDSFLNEWRCYMPSAGRFSDLSGEQQKHLVTISRGWACWVETTFFLLLDRFIPFVKDINNYEQFDWERCIRFGGSYEALRSAIARNHLDDLITKGHRFTPDFEGWKKYLKRVSPDFYHFLAAPIPARIREEDRLVHTYICSASRTGKSELLKRFVHSYLHMPDYCAAVVVDPASDFAEQIAKWQCNVNSDRLIYIDHDLHAEYTPTINPFEINGLTASDWSKDTFKVKQVIAQQIVEALKEIIPEGKTAFSGNMAMLLEACILTLLDYEGATLRHLSHFMIKELNRDLVAFALTRHHDPDTCDFFKHGFTERSVEQTKEAVARKLQRLLTGTILSDLTCGPSTVNLDQAWQEKKIIVLNLSKGVVGDVRAKAFGRLVIGALQGIAKRRAKATERPPCHLILDELDNWITDSLEEVLRESGKYGLIFTGAQQSYANNMDARMQKAIIGQSQIKIAGPADPPKPHADLVLVEPHEINALQKGQFYVRIARDKPAIKITVHDDLIGDRGAMTSAEWERVKAYQLKHYYRRTTPLTVEKPTVPEPVGHIAGQHVREHRQHDADSEQEYESSAW